MNAWHLIQEIFRSMDFYWRKFFLFLLIFAVIIGGSVLYKKNNTTEAEFAFSNKQNFASIYEKNINIEITKNGSVIIDGKQASNALKIYPDYYEIRSILVDNNGYYIGKISAVILLPEKVDNSQIKQIIYAIHGVGSYQSYIKDNDKLYYEIEDISETATVTIVAQLPKTILTPPLSKRAAYIINNIPSNIYGAVAVVLPLITLIIMLFMAIKRRKDQVSSFRSKPIDAPPSDIPPAVAGVLSAGQVGPREIAATLISLACRGYIFIIKKNNYFAFGKRKKFDLDLDPDLHLFERILLSKIFLEKEYKSTKQDVEMRVGHHIFSRKIAQVFLEIYNEATSLGYFVSNPSVVHRRWKYTGIALFFIGVFGFGYGSFFTPDPKFSLFFWVGEIALSTVIIKFAGLMPVRSDAGSRALNQWMAFRRYLKLNAPIEPIETSEDRFNKYLPFAVVYGVEVEWAKRFISSAFSVPEWYESENKIGSLEIYVNELYPLIGFVSKILAGSHDPTVE